MLNITDDDSLFLKSLRRFTQRRSISSMTFDLPSSSRDRQTSDSITFLH